MSNLLVSLQYDKVDADVDKSYIWFGENLCGALHEAADSSDDWVCLYSFAIPSNKEVAPRSFGIVVSLAHVVPNTDNKAAAGIVSFIVMLMFVVGRLILFDMCILLYQ